MTTQEYPEKVNLSGFKVYFSQKISGSFALAIVAPVPDRATMNSVEYFLCFPGASGGFISGTVAREEIEGGHCSVNRLSLCEIGSMAAETALLHLLLEHYRRTDSPTFDPAGLQYHEGAIADLWMIQDQDRLGEFLTWVLEKTQCTALGEVLASLEEAGALAEDRSV